MGEWKKVLLLVFAFVNATSKNFSFASKQYFLVCRFPGSQICRLCSLYITYHSVSVNTFSFTYQIKNKWNHTAGHFGIVLSFYFLIDNSKYTIYAPRYTRTITQSFKQNTINKGNKQKYNIPPKQKSRSCSLLSEALSSQKELTRVLLPFFQTSQSKTID